MPWSLDFFAAKKLAKAGKEIRRVAWADHTWVWSSGMLMKKDSTGLHVVKTTEYGEADLRARDWTDEPFTANPCSATPAFNSAPVVYGSWGDENPALIGAPPAPGFPDASV